MIKGCISFPREAQDCRLRRPLDYQFAWDPTRPKLSFGSFGPHFLPCFNASISETQITEFRSEFGLVARVTKARPKLKTSFGLSFGLVDNPSPPAPPLPGGVSARVRARQGHEARRQPPLARLWLLAGKFKTMNRSMTRWLSRKAWVWRYRWGEICGWWSVRPWRKLDVR